MAIGSAGQRVGPYRLVRSLGAGGMGEVWLGEHVEIASRVAIKLIAETADSGARERFLREAKAAASVRHPGIVAVSDFGSVGERGAYLVMELLDGESLAQRIARGPLATADAIELAEQIADALAAAHAAGIVHRDLKPANVFVARDPVARGGARVKLLDFGVAKAARHTDELGLTATGELVGTPLYMAPEQCASRLGPIDARTDLYSLGIVLFEMTTGAPPFLGPTLGDLVDQHVNAAPPAARTGVATLDALIARLLAKAMADRPASAGAVARELAVLAGRPRAAASQELALEATAASGSREPPIGATDETVGTVAAAKAVIAATPMPTRSRRRVRGWQVAIAAALAAAVVGVVVVSTRADVDERAAVHAPEHELAVRELAKDAPEPQRVFAWERAACDAGDLDGCVGLADVYRMGHGTRIDQRLAAQLYERGCAEGRAAACTQLAIAQRAGLGVAIDRDAALRSAALACALGDARGCSTAGEIAFARGGDAAATAWFAHAGALAEQACKRGAADACLVHADLSAGDLIGKPDHVRTIADMERACELRSARGCGDLGAEYISGGAVRRAPERGLAMLEASCKRDDPPSCAALGLVYAYGHGGSLQVERGRKLLEHECRDRGDEQCSVLATLYSDGRGVTKDPVEAARLDRRACVAGNGLACLGVATRLEAGGERDELLTRSCELAITGGCSELGNSAWRRKDYARARAWFARACRMSGGADGCGFLAGMTLRGEGGARDVAGAVALFEHACASGDRRACHSLGKHLVGSGAVPADPRRGLDILVDNCEHLWGASCDAAAGLLSDGKLVPADPTRAAELRTRGCEIDPRYCPATAVP